MSLSIINYTNLHLKRLICPGTLLVIRNKHWNPKFKKERARKVLKITLPDFNEQENDKKLSIEEMRAKLKEKGICPTRQWNEKPMYIGCTGTILDPFIPPEGDGQISAMSGAGMKQKYETFGKKGKSYMALRKIRNLDYEFDVPAVAEKAREIYIEAHEALCSLNEDKLHELVTEKAFTEMMENVKYKTIVWKYIQSLEIPRICHIRCEEFVSKTNLFAQVTVRLHSQQMLAVYDRFGRLMHGSEDSCRDVLEYIVLEKHISEFYGKWKIHGKIIPDWMPVKDDIAKTFYQPDIENEFPEPISTPKNSSEASEETLTPAVA